MKIPRNRLAWLLAGLLLVLVPVGCNMAKLPPNPYKPAGSRGGWSQTPVAPDRYLVFFMGTWSEEERVSDLGMLRAAELTLEHGFSHFDVLSQSMYVEGTDYNSTGEGMLTFKAQSDRLTAMILIQMLEEPSEKGGTVHDAKAIFDDLTEKY